MVFSWIACVMKMSLLGSWKPCYKTHQRASQLTVTSFSNAMWLVELSCFLHWKLYDLLACTHVHTHKELHQHHTVQVAMCAYSLWTPANVPIHIENPNRSHRKNTKIQVTSSAEWQCFFTITVAEAILTIVVKFTDEQYTTINHQLQDVSTWGSLSTAYK